MTDFFARLKQRKLVQWTVAYIAAAFALIQVIDVASDSYEWPHLVMHLVFGALALGFVVTLLLAWYHGERGAQRISGPELLLIALALAIGGGLLWHFEKTGSSPVMATVATTAGTSEGSHAVAAGGSTPAAASTPATTLAPQSKVVATPPIPAKSIAVLPFDNLSTDKGNAYFADGMQDLILTKLADIGDLKVISRTSTEQYGSHPQDLKTIGRQLGVATVLEGSVQKAGKQVLINVQLIDARTDNHVWAESYTRTLDNIFGVEGEVAQKVADALDAKLTATETQAVGKLPTRNPQAYDDYLRGQYFDNESVKGAFSDYLPQAIAAYGRAVAGDPGFALAWAALSNARTEARYWGVDRSEANLLAADMAAKRALALAPKLADGHLAMAGVERFLYRDFAKARAQNQQAADLRPNDPDAYNSLSINDAHLGELAASVAEMRRTIALDPADSFPEFDLGLFLTIGGHYAEAREALRRALALNPQDATAYVLLSQVEVLQNGNVNAAIKMLDNMAVGTPLNASVAARRIDLSLYRRDFAAARKLAAEYAGTFKSGPAAVTLAMARADVEWLAGDKDAARDLYRTAVELITKPGMDVGADDDLALGLAYARRGEAIEAMKENGIAESIDRRSHDIGYIEAQRIFNLAKIRLALGDDVGAIDNIARCLERDDCGLDASPAQVRVDPVWDPIRHDPRFQALLKKALDTGKAVAANAASPASG